MRYPLIERQMLAHFRLVHGMFNACVMALFFYHASLGLAIRRARLMNKPLPFPAIKRHRKMGPFLASAGGVGYCAGLILVCLDTGNIWEYPPHLLTGSVIIVLLIMTLITSKKIKGQKSSLRTPHAFIGIAILLLYVIEVFLGIGALL